MKSITIIFAVILLACSEDPIIYHIDDRLLPYFETFYAEAEKRGITIQRTNLIAEIVPNVKGKPGSQGATVRGTNGQITIQIQQAYFEANRQMCIEHLVFHECGHAFLDRGHTNGYSVMNDSVICFFYSQSAREVLIEELFNKR